MLNIVDLSKKIKNKQIIDSANLTIEKGRVFGVFGSENSGKTTLLRIILGVIKADSGNIIYNDSKFIPQNTNISYLPQKSGLYYDMKVYTQLKLLCSLKKMPKKDIDKNIKYWLKKFKIEELKNEKYNNISRENQQKIKLIALLIDNPDIIILDEPFRSIGFIGIYELKSILQELKEVGKIILIASEYLNYIEVICDDIAFMYNGILKDYGSIEGLIKSNSYNKISIKVKNCKDVNKIIGNLLSVKKIISVCEDEIIIELTEGNNIEDLIKDLFNKGVTFTSIGSIKKSLENIYMEEFRKELTNNV
ncbi:ABC transporter ATP-binding protein [Miniphocaeibacter massiliensis]|uniref:ABC transporter ATP-binding protein n=1 Tax=Miniphocaeibacter massiliensis TaxID=2041841 RepID=UPI000C083A0D|nr:ATP-binding cassette domain-containing protein [Miniphocaeibacter massiliensis]